MRTLDFFRSMGCVCGLILSMPAGAEEIQILVHAKNPLEKISDETLRKIFLGDDIHWSDKNSPRRILPAWLKPATDQKCEILQKSVGMDCAKFKVFWRRRMFSSQKFSPRKFATYQELVQYVATHPGAIGMVAKSEITAVPKTVKPLLLETTSSEKAFRAP